mmetsp:Transcript_76668/g.220013  ORF Transcript_76668/g.220013 Transcript_76668/m.220013 type:complete len:515 (+) Transcript_76668:205-1749(+)
MQRRSSINNAAHRPSISGPLGQSGDTRRSSISATAGVVGVVSTMRRPSISTRRPSAGNAHERRPSISGAGGGAARAPSNSRQSRGFGRQTSLNDTATSSAAARRSMFQTAGRRPSMREDSKIASINPRASAFAPATAGRDSSLGSVSETVIDHLKLQEVLAGADLMLRILDLVDPAKAPASVIEQTAAQLQSLFERVQAAALQWEAVVVDRGETARSPKAVRIGARRKSTLEKEKAMQAEEANHRQLENGFPSDESQGCDREEQGDGGTGRVREKSTVGSLPSFQRRTFKEVTTLGGGDFDDEESDEDMHGNDEDELRKSNAGGGLSFPLHRIDSVGDALRDGAASSPSPNGDQQRALGSEAKLSPPSNERHARFDLQSSGDAKSLSLSNGTISRNDTSGRGMFATQLAALGTVEDNGETLGSPQMLPFPGAATKRAIEDSGGKRMGGADVDEEKRSSTIDESPPGFKKLDARVIQNAHPARDAEMLDQEDVSNEYTAALADGTGELPPLVVIW